MRIVCEYAHAYEWMEVRNCDDDFDILYIVPSVAGLCFAQANGPGTFK